MTDDDAVVDAIRAADSLTSKLADELHRAQGERVTIGASGCEVVRFVNDERTLYAKYGPRLTAEAERLAWLAGRIGAPAVEHFSAEPLLAEDPDSGVDLLVTTEVAGLPAHVAMAGDPNSVVAGYGAHLAQLHSLPAAECPFDARPDSLHAAARARVPALSDDAEVFGGAYSHLSPTELFDRLDAMRPSPPADVDLVVVHGDFSMPNVLFDGMAVSGTIDVGRLGVGDRYCDLGVAARSLLRNVGSEALPVFFDAYGLAHPEMLRLDYHVVLDEFS